MQQLSTLLLLVPLIACNPGQKQNKQQEAGNIVRQTTEFEFTKEIHNFDELEAGEIAVFSFVFTNTGENNLWIDAVDAGCGCVQASHPQKPVKPGKVGEIELEFNSSGLYGKQMKTITVEANVPKPKHLAIFAEVKNEQLKIKY